MEQAEKGRLNGPFPLDTKGQVITEEGPQVANPVFRFGAPAG